MATKKAKNSRPHGGDLVYRLGDRAKRSSDTPRDNTYKAPKTGNNGVNFKELQRLVRRYNNQRRYQISQFPGEKESNLVVSGAVDPRIKGGATALLKNIRSDEELAKTLDMLNNKVKRKNSKSRADVYTARLEKKTGKTYSRDMLYLPKSRDEMVRWRFFRMLTEGSSINRGIIKKLVGDYNVTTMELKSKGSLTTDQMVKFFLNEPSLVNELYEYYNAGEIRSRKNVSKRLNQALEKHGYITKEEAKLYN